MFNTRLRLCKFFNQFTFWFCCQGAIITQQISKLFKESNWPMADYFIESRCPCVCPSPCDFFEASHWPLDQMISSRPLVPSTKISEGLTPGKAASPLIILSCPVLSLLCSVLSNTGQIRQRSARFRPVSLCF